MAELILTNKATARIWNLETQNECQSHITKSTLCEPKQTQTHTPSVTCSQTKPELPAYQLVTTQFTPWCSTGKMLTGIFFLFFIYILLLFFCMFSLSVEKKFRSNSHLWNLKCYFGRYVNIATKWYVRFGFNSLFVYNREKKFFNPSFE